MLFRKYWIFFVFFTLKIAQSLTPPRKGNCVSLNTRLACRKHLPINSSTNITTLELYNLNWDLLDFNKIVEKFPNVENVSVFGRNIFRLGPSMQPNKIKILQLKNLQITNISRAFMDSLPHIEVLNLEGNKLQGLDNNLTWTNLTEVNLFDNRWNCSLDMEWVLKLEPRIVTKFNQLICHGEPYSGKNLHSIAEFLQDVKTECPESCYCSLPNVVRDPISEMLEPIIEVNCSGRGLTEMPDMFPPKTKIIHLEDNEISDLSPLRENLIYRSVLDLFLDNNSISSIEVMEGSYWLTHFRVFSLSGNQLTEVPSYALDNALERNVNMPNAVRLSLGDNPWRCDCVFTPVFQEILQKYAPQVKDVDDIKCSYVEGDENSLLRIVDLSRSSVCRLPTEYSVQEALDLLNVVLASLIIFVLGKLAYDYYNFKKTGRLPWIVTKMP